MNRNGKEALLEHLNKFHGVKLMFGDRGRPLNTIHFVFSFHSIFIYSR